MSSLFYMVEKGKDLIQSLNRLSNLLKCLLRINYLLGKAGYVFVALVCLFVCGQLYSKSYEWIGMKFYGGVLCSTMKN